MTGPRKSASVRLFGWWYICLGLAFAALACRSLLLGASHLGIVLRCAIAAGFSALGVMTLRSAGNSRRER
jgi:hypothetical protein